jgi:hypothetical protein
MLREIIVVYSDKLRKIKAVREKLRVLSIETHVRIETTVL